MNCIFRVLGSLMEHVSELFYRYKSRKISNLLGIGGGVSYPYVIRGVKNVIMKDPIYIGPNSTIYTTRAKLVTKSHFISGPNLTIITGDHHYIVGKFIDQIKDNEKIPENDQDVVIEEDVWCGANVTILKGVTIGRGSVVAAGSVVTKSCPRYSVIGGVPAKVIKMKFTEAQIVEHEKKLYNN